MIQTRFRQLQEFHPRYQAILTRTGFWDCVLGFAAGYFGGGLGAMGAKAWDDWRGKSDTEFVQSFGNAVDQFSGATLAFTQKTEHEVESVITGFLKDFRDYTHGAIAALECITETTDLTKIFHELHDPAPPLKPDDNRRQFLEIVLSNLRSQMISARSEANIREMIGLR